MEQFIPAPRPTTTPDQVLIAAAFHQLRGGADPDIAKLSEAAKQELSRRLEKARTSSEGKVTPTAVRKISSTPRRMETYGTPDEDQIVSGFKENLHRRHDRSPFMTAEQVKYAASLLAGDGPSSDLIAEGWLSQIGDEDWQGAWSETLKVDLDDPRSEVHIRALKCARHRHADYQIKIEGQDISICDPLSRLMIASDAGSMRALLMLIISGDQQLSQPLRNRHVLERICLQPLDAGGMAIARLDSPEEFSDMPDTVDSMIVLRDGRALGEFIQELFGAICEAELAGGKVIPVTEPPAEALWSSH